MKVKEIKVGDVKIRVLKYFEENEEFHEGWIYLVEAEVESLQVKKQYIISDGVVHGDKLPDEILRLLGEYIKMGPSEIQIFQNGVIEYGGWVRLNTRELKQEEFIQGDGVEFDSIEVSRILDKNKNMILLGLVKENKKLLRCDLGIWESVKPLLIVFVSGRTIKLPDDAEIEFEPMSFRAVFRLGKIEFGITKATPKITDHGYCYKVQLGKRRWIAYKKIRYHPNGVKYVVYHGSPKKRMIYGYEQYNNILHQRAEMGESMEEPLWMYFKYRLGDVMFRPLFPDEEKRIRDKLNPYDRKPLYLQKVEMNNTKMSEYDGKLYLVPENRDEMIRLYHPEHGILMLEPGIYLIKLVQYKRYRHD